MRYALFAALLAVPAAGDNELTEQEKADGWVLLWNGRDSEGWTDGAGAALKADAIKDGTLNPQGVAGGMAYTKRRYGDFVFSCEFKVSPKCNSGVFFRTASLKDPVQTGFEVQVMDSAGKAKPGKHDCGALYDIQAPSSNPAKPAGEWNRMEITAKGPKVDIVLNGEKVVACDLDQGREPATSPDGTKNKFKTPLKDFAREGHFGLQDHGSPVWYRNLKVKPLK
jgi:hypothetical protein